MVKKVLAYTLSAPYRFLSGLVLISELLPLPLPIQSKESLSPEEVKAAVNSRMMWSAHLLPLASEIQQIISTLAGLCWLNTAPMWGRIYFPKKPTCQGFIRFPFAVKLRGACLFVFKRQKTYPGTTR